MSHVIVVGGGAAGMLAAIMAARSGKQVTLFEQNEKLGKKLYITGKGRCNLTNMRGRDDFFSNVPRNPRFLYSAYHAMDSEAVMAFFESLGVALKTERGGRVYPVSDKSSDVLRALLAEIQRLGVHLRLHSRVGGVSEKNGRVNGVWVDGVFYASDAVILATGGLSYPSTGSTGDGFAFAMKLGHHIISQSPSLIPLETKEEWPKTLSGMTLKNVSLRAVENGKCVYEEQGEMLFAHFGVTGPLVLSASAYLNEPSDAALLIDLKPALTCEQLDKRLMRELSSGQRLTVKNAFFGLLPKNLLPIALEEAGINGLQSAAEFTKKQRAALVSVLKGLRLTVKRTRPIAEAVVTRGGISTKEVHAKTMESKLIPGLYFAGEMLDLDALTGGYNLQIAWSTAALAGLNCE